MKICRMPECNEPQPLANFPVTKGKIENWCRSCKCKWHREYYATTRQRTVKRKWLRRAARRKWIKDLKRVPCMDCKIAFRPVCMDFDHRPGEVKHPALTRKNGYMAMSQFAGTYSDAVVRQEIAKCDIVCSNCHRIRPEDRRVGV